MANDHQITPPPPQWTSKRVIQVYCLITVLIYLVCVAFLAILKFTTHSVNNLSAPELFFGPAITVASAWIIGLLISAVVPARLVQDNARGRHLASVFFSIILIAIGVTFLIVHFVIYRATSASAFINHPEFYYTHFVIRDGSSQSDKSIPMLVGFWSYFTAIGGLTSVLWGLTRIFIGLKSKPQNPLVRPFT